MKQFAITVLLIAVLLIPLSAQVRAQSDMETSNIPQSSGFVDENGNPISIEAYEEMRENRDQGILRENPVIIGLLVFAMLCTVGLLVVRRKPTRKG